VCSDNSFAVQHLSSSMHLSVMPTDMSVWTNTDHPLRKMSAGDTLPLWTACTDLVTCLYSTAWPPNASAAVIGTIAHFYPGELFLSRTTAVPVYQLQFQSKVVDTMTSARQVRVHSSTLPYLIEVFTSICQRVFKRIRVHSILCVTSFLWSAHAYLCMTRITQPIVTRTLLHNLKINLLNWHISFRPRLIPYPSYRKRLHEISATVRKSDIIFIPRPLLVW
jgi:hypothetical protein